MCPVRHSYIDHNNSSVDRLFSDQIGAITRIYLRLKKNQLKQLVVCVVCSHYLLSFRYNKELPVVSSQNDVSTAKNADCVASHSAGAKSILVSFALAEILQNDHNDPGCFSSTMSKSPEKKSCLIDYLRFLNAIAIFQSCHADPSNHLLSPKIRVKNNLFCDIE